MLAEARRDLRQHPRERLADAAEAEPQGEPAEEAPGHGAEVDVEPRALGQGGEADDAGHDPHEPAIVEADRRQPLPGDPVPGHLDPRVRHAAGSRRAASHGAPVLELHLGEAERAVEAGRVGDLAPQVVGARGEIEGPEPLQAALAGVLGRVRVERQEGVEVEIRRVAHGAARSF